MKMKNKAAILSAVLLGVFGYASSFAEESSEGLDMSDLTNSLLRKVIEDDSIDEKTRGLIKKAMEDSSIKNEIKVEFNEELDLKKDDGAGELGDAAVEKIKKMLEDGDVDIQSEVLNASVIIFDEKGNKISKKINLEDEEDLYGKIQDAINDVDGEDVEYSTKITGVGPAFLRSALFKDNDVSKKELNEIRKELGEQREMLEKILKKL